MLSIELGNEPPFQLFTEAQSELEEPVQFTDTLKSSTYTTSLPSKPDVS